MNSQYNGFAAQSASKLDIYDSIIENCQYGILPGVSQKKGINIITDSINAQYKSFEALVNEHYQRAT
jgi:hypothetical protein